MRNTITQFSFLKKGSILLSITMLSVLFGIAQNNPVFFEDLQGHIKCNNCVAGDIGTVNGVNYEAVDNALLATRKAQQVDLTKLCTSLVTNTSWLFYYDQTFNQPIGNWDVSHVTNMEYMFQGCTSFNQPIGNWDVQNVLSMNNMFAGSIFNQPIGTWDVSHVTSMGYMFYYANNFSQSIGNWDVSHVTNMEYMFQGCTSFNQPIGNWDVHNVLRMNNMFAGSIFNQPIGNWDVSHVTSMSHMFYYANNFNQPVGNWNVTNVTNMDCMFQGCASFNQPIGNWDVHNVLSMGAVFAGCAVFNQPIGNWDVSHVTSMGYMFYYANNFNQSIGNWNVTNVTNMDCMFTGCTSFNQPIGNWDVSHVTSMSYMFYTANNFNQPVGNWDVSHVTKMDCMFMSCTSFNQPIGNWNVTNVTSMGYMFYNAINFNQPIGNWNVTNVTYMDGMFQGCTSFNQPINSWCVSNITSPPTDFSSSCPLTSPNTPHWGQPCPSLPPTAQSVQYLCSYSTVADLVASGTNIQWYSLDSSSYNLLSSSTTLVNNKTYYATQTSPGFSQSVIYTSVLVIILPPPVIVGLPYRYICAGGSAPLTATGGVSYLWSSGDVTASIMANQLGNYSVVATNQYGCTETSNTVTIYQKSLPAVVKTKIVGPNSVCYPNTVDFEFDMPMGTSFGFYYQWYLNNSPISGATDSIYLASGVSGSITLRLFGGPTCFKTSTAKNYTIKQLPDPSFIVSGPTTFCDGGGVTLTATTQGTSGYTYNWVNSNNTVVGSAFNKLIKVSGVYNLIAKLQGCTATSSNPVTVVVNPLPVASITASPNPVCSGSSTTITATSGFVNYSFVSQTPPPNPQNGSSNSFNIAPTSTNNYRVTVTDINGCSSTTTPWLKVGVNPLPIATITATKGGSVGAGTVFTAHPNGAGYTYNWKDVNGLSVGTTKTFQPTNTGNYTVEITRAGCTGISTPYTAVAKPELGITNTTDGSFEISAYPNPVNDLLTFSIAGVEEVNGTLQLIDMNGKLFLSQTITEPTISIDMKDYASGLYFLRYKDAEGRTGTVKVVKE